MRVEVNLLESGTEPGVSVQHQPALMMALRTLSSRWSMLPLASDRSVCTTIQPRTGRKWSIWFWTASVPSFFVGLGWATY